METATIEARGSERAGLTYLIELAPLAPWEVRLVDDRLSRASDEMARSGRPVRYLGTVSSSDEEGVVVEVEASLPEIAAAVAQRAGVSFDRVTESIRMGSARVRGDVCLLARGARS
jgi:hypothetical protein